MLNFLDSDSQPIADKFGTTHNSDKDINSKISEKNKLIDNKDIQSAQKRHKVKLSDNNLGHLLLLSEEI